jgi:uncharacterized protein (DUF486 family)
MLSTLFSTYSRPILLLIGSNLFMTFAWYGHLRFKQVPLMGVIVASWAIAFVEYCMAVPANRWGSAVYTTAQLKTMQEVITLLVFVGFSILYLREPMTWNYAIGFALIAGGAYFIFRGTFLSASRSRENSSRDAARLCSPLDRCCLRAHTTPSCEYSIRRWKPVCVALRSSVKAR